MKARLLLVGLCLAFSACATRQPSAPEASTAAVAQTVATATTSTERAQAANAAAAAHVAEARSVSERMDSKAAVILKWWETAK